MMAGCQHELGMMTIVVYYCWEIIKWHPNDEVTSKWENDIQALSSVNDVGMSRKTWAQDFVHGERTTIVMYGNKQYVHDAMIQTAKCVNQRKSIYWMQRLKLIWQYRIFQVDVRSAVTCCTGDNHSHLWIVKCEFIILYIWINLDILITELILQRQRQPPSWTVQPLFQ